MASQEQSSSSDQPPLWNFVSKVEKLAGAGGSWKFKCKFCSETKQGSYYRVRAHLLGITGNVVLFFGFSNVIFVSLLLCCINKLLNSEY